MAMKIASLQPKHLEAAGALVAASDATLRSQVPCLPAKYEDAGTISRMLHDLSEAGGVVALHGGELVGFLTGFVLPEYLGRRSFYSPEWANGAEPGNSRQIYEEMYQQVAAHWIADGCAVHAVTLMTHNREGIEGWQWLGFGLAAVDGVRDLTPVPGVPTNLDVRQAGLQDAGELTSLGRALEQHMAAPPVFWIHETQDFVEWLQQPEHVAWLAYDGEEAVGCLGLELGHGDECEIVQDEDTARISMAYTRRGARCRGIGTALLDQALAWARARGCRRCAVDWEPMNPPANRFWTRWFDPVCYSLVRWIDGRILARSGGSAI
jgi:GNAT superfamily N-acetyltransferase